MSEPREGGRGPSDPEPVAPWLPVDLDVERPPRPTARKVAAAVLSAVLVAALLIWVLPWVTGATWPGIVASFSALPGWALPAVTVLGIAAIGLEAVTVRTAVRGSRYVTALQGNAASNALALAIPGGAMLGMGLLGWILRRAGTGLGVIITGLIAASLAEMLITSVLIPVLGLGAYALSSLLAGPELSLPGAFWAGIAAVAGGVIVLVLTAVVLRRRVLSGILDQLDQVGLLDQLVRVPRDAVLAQRDALLALLRGRSAALLLPTVLARLAQWAALLVALEAVGAQVPVLLTIAIFALGRVLSLVPVTPAGAGITETVGAAALVALGVGAEPAATAMLLLAIATLAVPLLGGGIAAVTASVQSSSVRSSS